MQYSTVQGLVTAALGVDGFAAGWVRGEGFMVDVHFNVDRVADRKGQTRVEVTAALTLGGSVSTVRCEYTRHAVKVAIAQAGLAAIQHG